MKGRTFTTALALAALALGMLGLLARRTVVSVSRISMNLKQPICFQVSLATLASTGVRKRVSHD